MGHFKEHNTKWKIYKYKNINICKCTGWTFVCPLVSVFGWMQSYGLAFIYLGSIMLHLPIGWVVGNCNVLRLKRKLKQLKWIFLFFFLYSSAESSWKLSASASSTLTPIPEFETKNKSNSNHNTRLPYSPRLFKMQQRPTTNNERRAKTSFA